MYTGRMSLVSTASCTLQISFLIPTLFSLALLSFPAGRAGSQETPSSSSCPHHCNCSVEGTLLCTTASSLLKFPRMDSINANLTRQIYLENQKNINNIILDDLDKYKNLEKLVIRRCGRLALGPRLFSKSGLLREIIIEDNFGLDPGSNGWIDQLQHSTIEFLSLNKNETLNNNQQLALLDNFGSYVITRNVTSQAVQFIAAINIDQSLKDEDDKHYQPEPKATPAYSVDCTLNEKNFPIPRPVSWDREDIKKASLIYLKSISTDHFRRINGYTADCVFQEKNLDKSWTLTIYMAPKIIELKFADSVVTYNLIGLPEPTLEWFSDGKKVLIEKDNTTCILNNYCGLIRVPPHPNMLNATNVLGTELRKVTEQADTQSASFKKRSGINPPPKNSQEEFTNATNNDVSLQPESQVVPPSDGNHRSNWLAVIGLCVLLLLVLFVVFVILCVRHAGRKGMPLIVTHPTLPLLVFKTPGNVHWRTPAGRRQGGGLRGGGGRGGGLGEGREGGNGLRGRDDWEERQPIVIPSIVVENVRYCPAVMTVVTDLDISADVKYISRKQIQLISELGQGEFGKVYLGLCTGLRSHDDITMVAIKTLKSEEEGRVGDGEGVRGEVEERMLDDFEREAELLNGMRHRNIVTFYGISFDDLPLMMVLEFMENGDLNNYLRSHGPDASLLQLCHIIQQTPISDVITRLDGNDDITVPPVSPGEHLSTSDLLYIAWQIACGVEHMASRRFVHRDLASRNCLVGQRLVCKIGDFGMSRDLYSSDYFRVGNNCLLPIRWMPPESLLYRTFTVESDVWSYGVLLWEIFTYGRQPWCELSNHEVIQHVQDGKQLPCPRDSPPGIDAILAGCWRRQPTERMTMTEIRSQLEESLRGNVKIGEDQKRHSSSSDYLELINN